jgi:hypothetical protein
MQYIIPYCEGNDVHITKFRTRVIYSIKELEHFWSQLLVDFPHVRYNTKILCLYLQHSKAHTIKRIYLKLRLHSTLYMIHLLPEVIHICTKSVWICHITCNLKLIILNVLYTGHQWLSIKENIFQNCSAGTGGELRKQDCGRFY